VEGGDKEKKERLVISKLNHKKGDEK